MDGSGDDLDNMHTDLSDATSQQGSKRHLMCSPPIVMEGEDTHNITSENDKVSEQTTSL